MGKFLYGGLVKVDFEDRTLTHLQVVIGAKVRRGESFSFTWKDDPSIGGGRTTVWINPQAPMVYKFYGSRPAQINWTWVEALMRTANATTGLYVVREPPEHTTGSP